MSMLCIAGWGSESMVETASGVRDSDDDVVSDDGRFSDGGLSAAISTAFVWTDSAGFEVPVEAGGVSVFKLEAPGVGGSGSDSRLDWLQCGQCQPRELVLKYQMVESTIYESETTYRAASLFRSDAGYSIEPTPTAACPFSGKKPCNPMIAIREYVN